MQFTLRMKISLMEKIQYIADKEDRSRSKVIERMIKSCIAAYEQEHGEIVLGKTEE